MGRPGLALEYIYLDYNTIDVHVFDYFVNSLRNNGTVKELILIPNEFHTTQLYRYDTLTQVLCDESSIMATFQSNLNYCADCKATLQKRRRGDGYQDYDEDAGWKSSSDEREGDY